jgi:hypothetical protein
VLTACASGITQVYEGAERKLEEVAIITDSADFSVRARSKVGGHVTLVKVDETYGDNESPYYFRSLTDGKTNVAVLPGDHTLYARLFTRKTKVFTAVTTRSIEDVPVRFRAVKGHTYLLSFHSHDNLWTPVLIDLTDWKKLFPAQDIKIEKGATVGLGVREWVKGTPIRYSPAGN